MGYLSLFISALLAATVLPVSSEILFSTLLLAGHSALALWLVATLGNVLGALVNWGLGRYCLAWQDRPWFPISPAQLAEAQQRFARYGYWSLLLAWLPLIGDALTLAAGVLRVPLGLFTLLVTLGKGGRYALLIGVMGYF